jgi:hypothetical protein
MPVIQVWMHLPGITSLPVSIDFLVDSGATGSCVHPQDAMLRLGLSEAMLSSPQFWASTRVSRGVGGEATSYVHPATYTFVHDDGRLQQIDGDIHIAQLTPTNLDIPSLLGWDILRFFRIELEYHLNPAG